MFYFCTEYIEHVPINLEVLPFLAPISQFPTAFGSMVFSFEGIAVVLPLKNSMKYPEKFGQVLNIGMIGVTLLYITMGIVGFITFGENVCGSITLNLPEVCTFLILWFVSIRTI